VVPAVIQVMVVMVVTLLLPAVFREVTAQEVAALEV
jgi:hypothetical protein